MRPPSRRPGRPSSTLARVPGRRTDRERSAELERLAREIRGCQLCALARSRTHAVVYRGSPRPRAVFVGEAPGAEEDRVGVPFVGRSGRILDRAIADLGPELGPFGVLNILKCRPPNNRFDPVAAATCRPYLDRQLAVLSPDVLVSLGARALRALAPDAPPVLTSAGHELASPYGPLFPLVHPAATLRSRRLAERWSGDVRALRSWLGRRRR